MMLKSTSVSEIITRGILRPMARRRSSYKANEAKKASPNARLWSAAVLQNKRLNPFKLFAMILQRFVRSDGPVRNPIWLRYSQSWHGYHIRAWEIGVEFGKIQWPVSCLDGSTQSYSALWLRWSRIFCPLPEQTSISHRKYRAKEWSFDGKQLKTVNLLGSETCLVSSRSVRASSPK